MSSPGPAPVLVTGAGGFVGAAVTRALQRHGYSVRGLVRRSSGRLEPGVEPAVGDILDRESLARAAAGCQAVVHCAADYRLALRAGEATAMVAVNVGGTANVLRAARAAGVRRVVHCSTVGTLAFDRRGRICTEDDLARSPANLAGTYKRSKWAAHRLALAGGGSRPEVVVVQPSTPLGSGDRRPTPTGATIRDFLAGRIPAVVATGLNLVDVEAVGEGHVLALESGTAGRSYILGDRNWTLRQLLEAVAAVAGTRPPRWRIPIAVALAAAVGSESWGRLRQSPPAVPLTSVRMAAHPMYVDAARARSELGWNPGDLAGAIECAVAELRGAA